MLPPEESVHINKNDDMPSVAVVILNWNGRKFLEQFLPSVILSTYLNKRIIVADNGSTDDSIVYLEENFPSIEIIRNPLNEGYAKGYNTALKQVKADIYVLLNSDVEVTPGWIEPVIEVMSNDKTIAACQPKLLAYHNKTTFEYAGASGGWMDRFGYPFMRGRVFDDCETDNGQFNDTAPCFWASGAALFIRSECFREMNGFDEYFFAHQEEIDLCWRLQLAGYKIYVVPASEVYHVGGGTLPKGNSMKTYLNFRNNLVMMHKNLPANERWWKVIFRIALNKVAAFRELISGDPGYFVAVMKANLHYLGWIISAPKSKRIVIKGYKINGYFDSSIVWAYFIKKRRTFSEIIGTK